MATRKTHEQFILEANEVHGTKYNYSLVEYANNKTKIKIICDVHGIFTQTPADHVGKSANCPRCSGRAPNTTSNFIKVAEEIHDKKYDYSLVDYKNNHTKVKIICPEHGIFEMTPKSHVVQSQNCPRCSYIMRGNNLKKSQEQFILEANEVHDNQYDYSLIEYKNSTTKIKIKCPIHGAFHQLPGNHINLNQGCPHCYNERRPGSMGGYCESYFEKNPTERDIQGKLYVIEMTGQSDHFIKIGITKRSIKERFAVSGLGDKYFTKNVINIITIPLYDAWLLEQQILAELKEYQYFPNYKFSGQTECFKVKDKVIECIESITTNFRRKQCHY